jgi:hypothetical protein
MQRNLEGYVGRRRAGWSVTEGDLTVGLSEGAGRLAAIAGAGAVSVFEALRTLRGLAGEGVERFGLRLQRIQLATRGARFAADPHRLACAPNWLTSHAQARSPP